MTLTGLHHQYVESYLTPLFGASPHPLASRSLPPPLPLAPPSFPQPHFHLTQAPMAAMATDGGATAMPGETRLTHTVTVVYEIL